MKQPGASACPRPIRRLAPNPASHPLQAESPISITFRVMASGSRQLTRVALPVVAPGKDARCLDMGQIYCVLSSQLGDAFTTFTAAAVLED